MHNVNGSEYDPSVGIDQDSAAAILLGIGKQDVWSCDPFACVERAADEAYRNVPLGYPVELDELYPIEFCA